MPHLLDYATCKLLCHMQYSLYHMRLLLHTNDYATSIQLYNPEVGYKFIKQY